MCMKMFSGLSTKTAALGGALSFLGKESGIGDYGHLKSEGDASITRGDFTASDGIPNSNERSYPKFFLDESCRINADCSITADSLASHQNNRKLYSIATNPNYFSPAFAGVAFAPAAHLFVNALMSNQSAEHPEGKLTPETLMSFFSYTKSPSGALTYTFGHERIPNNFYKRAITNPWTMPDILLGVGQQCAAFPDTCAIGGNTGTVNSFAGISAGEVSSEVFNGFVSTDAAWHSCENYGDNAWFRRRAGDTLKPEKSETSPAKTPPLSPSSLPTRAMPSYSTLLDTYSQGIPCPPCFSFPTHVLDKWSAYDPNLLAILWVAPDFSKEVKVTYRDLEGLSHRSAVVLAGLGVKKGDRVLIQLPRVVEWWTVVFGLLRIGAVPVPGTSLLMSKDLKFRATSSKAIAFIGDSSACERFEEVAGEVGVKTIVQVRVDGDGGLGAGRVDFQSALKGVAVGTRYVGESLKSTDLAMLYFTSGTTGNPKQVLLENEYLLGHTITGHWYRLGVGKLFLNLADAGWAKFGYSTFGAFNHGATLVIQPPAPGPFSPLSVLSLLHKYPITTLCCPPTIYRSLVTSASKEYYRTNPPIALEHCVGAGEPLNPSVIVEFKELSGGIEICDGWGQTETIILVGNWEGETIRPGSMGQVAPGGFEVNVVGPKGEEMGVGEEGELAVRTDCGAGSKWIFKGYVKGDGSVDKREKEYAGKRWYCTGDRGTRDADGYFWFVGRDDDVITSAGYRIGPFEVESALKEHPAVLESAAVASPDAERHEIVKAFIILSAEYASRLSPLSPSARSSAEKALIVEIQNHVKKTAAPYKYPREIEFVNSLPLTVSGKIRRLELRNLEYQRKEHIAKALKARL